QERDIRDEFPLGHSLDLYHQYRPQIYKHESDNSTRISELIRGDMIISRLNPTNTITVKLSKTRLDSFRYDSFFEAKFFLLSSGNTSTIPVGDQVNNTVPIPPEIPTITNAEIKRLTGPSNGQEDTNRNDPYGVSAARGSGRNYFLITLVAQNNPDDTTGLPTNFTVLVITQPISSAAMLRFNPIWCDSLSHYDYNMGGDRGRRGNRDKEKMMVDLITPFRPQDYYSTNKIHTEWNGITRGSWEGNRTLDDIDKFSLKDFKICQAKKLVNFHHHPSGNQPSLAGQHDHDKEDQLTSSHRYHLLHLRLPWNDFELYYQ
ncbi:hypothetical protein PSTT_10140, partial [Puccinia striiformis]